jgi:hypothetical protein
MPSRARTERSFNLHVAEFLAAVESGRWGT